MGRPFSDGAIELRALTLDDADEHLAGEDHEWAHWLGGGVSSIEDVSRAIEHWMREWQSGGPIRNFGVWDVASGRLLGNMEVNLGNSLDGVGVDEANLAYGVFAHARRRGVATAAVDLACEYLRASEPSIIAAVIRVDPRNIPSAAVAERAGFRADGEVPGDHGAPMLRYVRSVRSATYSDEVLGDLAARVRARQPASGTCLVGIDGPGGAGKSTLAADLVGCFAHAAIVHMDDLYLSAEQRRAAPTGIGTNYDRKRLIDQVLRPLRERGTARYQRYDWDTDAVADWIDIAGVDVVIVEGVTAIADDVAGHYDLTVWVETPLETCLQRGVERDGEAMRARWVEIWLPGDDQYRRAHRPDARADCIIFGSS